jgi:hypothetical protein
MGAKNRHFTAFHQPNATGIGQQQRFIALNGYQDTMLLKETNYVHHPHQTKSVILTGLN